ncbi:MAG: hypothetical protein CVU00_04690 [Bacteroidetes bacterium HGW-Bacteroidetes-17]|jgi:hypothetical protein|nr:MAG: hypothetical protein CVU00_04690 [Bacteroidetes bacterium HGW-Bacteroidetes-17]
MEPMDNIQILTTFVEENHLMNSHSIVDFMALVTIKTAKNKITNQEMRIMVSFDDYPVLSILEDEIDPMLYPTVLKTQWDDFDYKDNEYLQINGFHAKNPNIGKYSVKIIPLHKIKE